MRATLADGRTVIEPVKLTGATYRQLDYWVRIGVLKVPESGSGRSRMWPESELRIAAAIRRLTAAGMTLDFAARLARDFVVDGFHDVELDPAVTIYLDDSVADLIEEL